MTKIHDIEGIGPVNATSLLQANIDTVEELLEAGKTAAGRQGIAEKTGLDESDILRWVNMADLFRLTGVGEEYSDLLEAAGVDTVKELRNRVAENLHAKMLEVNAVSNLVNKTPSVDFVAKWIEEAKTLEPMVTH